MSLKTRPIDHPVPAQGSSSHHHWRWIHSQLKREYGPAQYERWLKPLRLAAVDGGVAQISVPTDFIRDWVERNYLSRIRTLFAAGPEPVSDVRVVVGAAEQKAERKASAGADGAAATRPVRATGANIGDSLGGRLTGARADGDGGVSPNRAPCPSIPCSCMAAWGSARPISCTPSPGNS